jgi:hypothetical protein
VADGASAATGAGLDGRGIAGVGENKGDGEGKRDGEGASTGTTGSGRASSFVGGPAGALATMGVGLGRLDHQPNAASAATVDTAPARSATRSNTSRDGPAPARASPGTSSTYTALAGIAPRDGTGEDASPAGTCHAAAGDGEGAGGVGVDAGGATGRGADGAPRIAGRSDRVPGAISSGPGTMDAGRAALANAGACTRVAGAAISDETAA